MLNVEVTKEPKHTNHNKKNKHIHVIKADVLQWKIWESLKMKGRSLFRFSSKKRDYGR